LVIVDIGRERSTGMALKGRQNPLSTLDPTELEAQRIACTHLVKGCERALFHFGLIAGETPSAEAAEIDGRAIDIMSNVLRSWRDTLSLLPTPGAAPPQRRKFDSYLVVEQASPTNSTAKRRTV
jgi:hypothetical protein